MSSFVGGFTKILSGNLIAQSITFAAYPFITRIYSAEEMGIFSIILSVFLVLGQVLGMALNEAVIIAKDRRELNAVFELTTIISLLYLLVILACSFVVVKLPAMQVALGLSPELLPYIWFVPLGALCINLVVSANCLAIREKHLGLLSIAKISEAIVGRAVTLGMGLMHFGPLGLLTGHLIGLITSIIVLLKVIPGRAELLRELSFLRMREVLVRFKTFPLYGQWGVWLQVLSRELPVFLIGALFGSAAAGFYGLGARIVNLPLFMFGDSVHKVFLQQASIVRDDLPKLSALTLKLLYYMASIALPGVFVLCFFGPEFMAFVFGKEWWEAGVYLHFLVFYYFFIFIMRPLGGVYIFKEKQKILMKFDFLVLMGIIASLIGSYYYGADSRSAILALGLTCPILIFINVCSALHMISVSYRHILRTIISIIVRQAPLIFCLGLIKYFITDVVWILFCSFFVCVTFYLVFALTDPEAIKLVLEKKKSR